MKQYIFGSVLCCTALTSGYALAACTQTPDCETMGYIYTADECPNGGVKCPFDINKYFCFDPSENENSSVPTSGYCCGYTDYCGFSGGTLNSFDNDCQSHWAMSCYNKCKSYGYPDCPDMLTSCQASGGAPVFHECIYDFNDTGYYKSFAALFECQ